MNLETKELKLVSRAIQCLNCGFSKSSVDSNSKASLNERFMFGGNLEFQDMEVDKLEARA